MNGMTTGPRPSDRLIPWYIVLFFAVQAVFFAVLYYLSVTTGTGLVTEGAYEKGLKYNATIEKYEAQEKRGWTSSITREKGGIAFVLKDRQGRPLSATQAELWFFRPVRDGKDLRAEMKEMAPGKYFAAVFPPEKGLWEVRVHAQTPEGAYQSARRMVFE